MNTIAFSIGYIVAVLMVHVSSADLSPKKLSCDYNATKYTCILHHEELKDRQKYVLSQIYNIKPLIGVDITISARYIKLIMEFESFDNNTSVTVVNPENKNDEVWSNDIILAAKDVVQDKIVGTLNYSGSTDIQFSCKEYISPPKINNALIVLINTKENKIEKMYKAKEIDDKIRINMEDNGWILCCLYYSYEWTDGKYLQITRVVDNKTLLIYQPEELVSHKVKNPTKEFSCDYNATKYICTLHHEKLQDQRYVLRQIYNTEFTVVLNVSITANTQLIMELESFDNNTSVTVAKAENENDEVWSNDIILAGNDVAKDEIVGTLNYSESADIQFNCEEYISPPKTKNLYTVLIDTKKNEIKLLNKTSKNIDKHRIKMENNGSILCCLYYSYAWAVYGQAHTYKITRVISNKTLLVYQPNVPVSPKVENSTDTKDLALSSTQSNNYRWMVYVLTPTIGVSVLILGLYFISKRGWLKNSQPHEETVDLNNMTHQNQVLYADLNFVKNTRNQVEIDHTNHQSRDINEESHYATIIGELHPH